MFIQVIQGMCTDEATLRQHMDRWREELDPGAEGWLGGTYGMTDDDQFVGVVRFESRGRGHATPPARAGRVVGEDASRASTATSPSTTATT